MNLSELRNGIKLINLNIASGQSEETLAYSADLVIWGRVVGHVSNSGQGGESLIVPGVFGRPFIQDVERRLAALPARRVCYFGHDLMMQTTLEDLCDRMAEEEHVVTYVDSCARRGVRVVARGSELVQVVKGEKRRREDVMLTGLPRAAVIATVLGEA